MRGYAKKNREAKLGKFYGLSSTWTILNFKGKKQKTSPEMGEILLAEKHLTARIVSHECTHAALGWASRKKLDLKAEGKHGKVSNIEEAFCHAQGNFVSQI